MEFHLKCEKLKGRQAQQLIILLGMLGNGTIELLRLHSSMKEMSFFAPSLTSEWLL